MSFMSHIYSHLAADLVVVDLVVVELVVAGMLVRLTMMVRGCESVLARRSLCGGRSGRGRTGRGTGRSCGGRTGGGRSCGGRSGGGRNVSSSDNDGPWLWVCSCTSITL